MREIVPVSGKGGHQEPEVAADPAPQHEARRPQRRGATRGGCASSQQRCCQIIPPLLPRSRKNTGTVTYRFSGISFVSSLPRLTLLSLHTTAEPVTTGCSLESPSTEAACEPPMCWQAATPSGEVGTDHVLHIPCLLLEGGQILCDT